MMIHFHPTSAAGAPTVTPAETHDAIVTDLALEDLPVGSTRLARIDGHRVCVARTADGVFAVDHACPHEGYGLTQGSLDGNLLTCQWHNWKFDVTTGACTQGEEDVPTHDVSVTDDGVVAVRLRRPEPVEQRPRLFASLERGLAKDYVGQIARDVVRLLAIGVEPAEIVAVGVRYGAPRGEYGWGHAIAALTDCLAMVELFDGEQRAIPIVQGLSFVAHDERGRPAKDLPESAPLEQISREAFLAAVESEDLVAAQSIVLGAIAAGSGPAELHHWFLGAVSAHLLSYGHGAIYTQKAFELLELIGWDEAPIVLGHLVESIVTGTREDTLPYHRPFGRVVDTVDLGALAAGAEFADLPVGAVCAPAAERLATALSGSDREEAARATIRAIRDGVSLDAVLDVVVSVVAERMLRHDTSVEDDLDDDFGWLDITHGVTFADAARALLARERARGALDGTSDSGRLLQEELVGLVLHCAFLAHWTGRHEWHTRVQPRAATAIDAHLAAPSADLAAIGRDLQRRSLDDVHTAPIHVEHAVKMSRAAHLEAARSGSGDVLAATVRYFDDHRRERGVRAVTHRSIEFVSGRLRR